MSEQAIETVVAPAIQEIVTDLTPEAKALLQHLDSYVTDQVRQLDAKMPQLIDRAKTDAEGALQQAEGHLSLVFAHVRALLGLTPGSTGAPTVDPTSAVPAPQQ